MRQTYQAQIPSLFTTNVVLVASDGVEARVGSLGAGKEWFKPWRTITGRDDAHGLAELQVVLEGVFEKRRFLDLIRHFIVFEDEGAGKLTKKIAEASPKRRGATTPGQSLAATRAIVASAWSGTRKVRARVSRWHSMPAV
jgi:type I restriction enzyme, R subunit